MSKQLHPGKAALNGLLSALLAQRGFTGARKILEGEMGFFNATSMDFDGAKCLANLGKEFFFERNSIKYHASCGHTHSAIDAVLQATQGNEIAPENVESVSVAVYQGSLDLLMNIEPTTPYLAKFHLPFCVALAMRYGHVNVADFTPERIRDPTLIRMIPKIKIQSDPELSAMYPRKWPARVEIVMRSGERLTGATKYPKGDPENPLSESEILGKFKSLTWGLITDDFSDVLCQRVMALESSPDVSTLLTDEAG
jgi:2-methylcitrate dehydratase PrpD